MCCAYRHHRRRHHSDSYHSWAQLVPRLHSWLRYHRRQHHQEVMHKRRRCHQIRRRRRRRTCRCTNQSPNRALRRYRRNHQWLHHRGRPSSYCPGYQRRRHRRRLPSSDCHLRFHFQSYLRNRPTPVGKRSNLIRRHLRHHLLWIQTHLMPHPWNRQHHLFRSRQSQRRHRHLHLQQSNMWCLQKQFVHAGSILGHRRHHQQVPCERCCRHHRHHRRRQSPHQVR
ncbi:unannotated protein [freshwater metagenome]|uniref:Unannotated protein n=1 Tax=freshwater metagenome TaxID=449393 RepID=A0A6J6K9R4_9ZZZZ